MTAALATVAAQAVKALETRVAVAKRHMNVTKLRHGRSRPTCVLPHGLGAWRHEVPKLAMRLGPSVAGQIAVRCRPLTAACCRALFPAVGGATANAPLMLPIFA